MDEAGGDHAFGTRFTPHMVTLDWTAEEGWGRLAAQPHGPLVLDPAAAVLQYAQAVFEGLKAFRFPDGSVHLFRPDLHARRLQASARRLVLPELEADRFLESVRLLLDVDRDEVPAAPSSLYLRPTLIATEAFLGVRAARAARYFVIGSRSGRYFRTAADTVDIWVSRRFSRAGRGGTGAAKTGGNYAASLAAQQEAAEHGCQQVLFLDAEEGRYLEELGGMNLVLVRADGSLLTPASDSILAGVTVESILALAQDRGLRVERRRIELAEWIEGASDGSIVAAFACGTAAVVAPIGTLRGADLDVRHPAHPLAELPYTLRDDLLRIQRGLAPDARGWMVPADA